MSKIIKKQPEKSDIIPGVGPSENDNHHVIEDDKRVNNDKSQNDGHQDSLRSSEAGVRSSPCLPRQSQPPGPEAAATTPLARVTRQPMTPLARVSGQQRGWHMVTCHESNMLQCYMVTSPRPTLNSLGHNTWPIGPGQQSSLKLRSLNPLIVQSL